MLKITLENPENPGIYSKDFGGYHVIYIRDWRWKSPSLDTLTFANFDT